MEYFLSLKEKKIEMLCSVSKGLIMKSKDFFSLPFKVHLVQGQGRLVVAASCLGKSTCGNLNLVTPLKDSDSGVLYLARWVCKLLCLWHSVQTA